MARFYQDAAGNWQVEGPLIKPFSNSTIAATGQPTTYEEQLKSSIPGTLANDNIVRELTDIADFTQAGNPTLPANTPAVANATGATATTPTYTPATDYTVPAATPTANAPTLPTGTNVAAATTATMPTYGGATTYSKKYKSPFASSGAWPVTNKKYPYKSSLFKTQTSELL